jgi:hypothetical protein
LSLIRQVVTLRTLGTARTGAYFSVSPWPVVPNERRLLERPVDRFGSDFQLRRSSSIAAVRKGETPAQTETRRNVGSP